MKAPSIRVFLECKKVNHDLRNLSIALLNSSSIIDVNTYIRSHQVVGIVHYDEDGNVRICT